jgi:predicted amidohydrolase YtcJ
VPQLPNTEADLILANGKIRTPAHPSRFVQALAARDGMITALGNDDDIRQLAGPRTRVVDLRGRLALPAFGDAHIHAVSGGLESLRCNLLGLRTRPDCLAAVAAYCQDLPPDAWVLGGGWAMEAFPGGTPTAADLDTVTGGRPAFIPNRDHHSAWVNTEALRRGGVDARTPDPADGRIERDAAGNPAGALHDGAMRLVGRHLPATSTAELTDGLLAAQAYLHSLGITSWQDACVGPADELGIPDAYEAYRRAAADGLLTSHVTAALWWDRTRGVAQLEDLLTRREQARDGRFRATTVKLMLDGVCETGTAAMSAPYLDGHGHSTGHRGRLFIEPDELRDATGRLAAEGFQLHFHALGDLAVSTALDVLEALPAEQRQAGRHHLAHLQFITPRDMNRFRALDAVANFQPLWACSDPQMEELTLPFVGPERALWQYQIGALARRGTQIAFGSDWPVSTPDPLQEMHVAVNRVLSERQGQPGTPECDKPFLLGQAILLEDAVDAFTTGVAWVNHAEEVTGELRPGMRADVAVLDQDLYSIPASGIGSTTVDLTVAGGKVVFGDEE